MSQNIDFQPERYMDDEEVTLCSSTLTRKKHALIQHTTFSIVIIIIETHQL